jgi:mevalonate kinase
MSADKNDTNRVEMRAISFYELPSRVLKRGKKHPSHKLINHIINSKEWSKFVPNSKSKTYKTFQTIWISQNLTIRELMNFYLLDIDELSKKHFHKPTDRLNIYEIIKLINIKEGLGEPSDISIKKLKEIFPMKYKNI